MDILEKLILPEGESAYERYLQHFKMPRFIQSSYPVRKKILKACSPTMGTHEAFTYTLLPKKFNDISFLKDFRNWVPERIGEVAKICHNQLIHCIALSKCMPELIIATRGNSGVAKTFWIEQTFTHLTRSEKQWGTLNPDQIKMCLRTIQGTPLLNIQVYKEGRILFENLFSSLSRQWGFVKSGVIDTRLLTLEEFKTAIIFASLRNLPLKLIDVDAPLRASILSVLLRDPQKQDPCVSFEVILEGFIAARQNRFSILMLALENAVEYKLFHRDLRGHMQLIAENNKNTLRIYFKDLFEKCIKTHARKKLEVEGNVMITADYFHGTTDEQKKRLKKWIGKTVKKALEINSLGGKVEDYG